MLNQNENLVAKAVEFYISENPERARRIADDKGVDYDICVKNFFLKRFEEKEIHGSECYFKVKFKPESIYSTIKDTAGFLQFLAEQLVKFPEPRLLTVLLEVSDLFVDYRDLILDILVFKTNDKDLIDKVCQANKILPIELNNYFNLHWKEKGLSVEENTRIARKIVNRFSEDLPVFDAQITKWYRMDLLIKFKNKTFENPNLSKYFQDLSLSEKKYLVEKVINELINQKQYIEAADFAIDFGKDEKGKLYLEPLKDVAAGLAYKRCFDNNQFKEAAEITLKYDIGDFRHAAERELERMEKIDESEYNHGKRTMVSWAAKFGLKLREDQIFSSCDRPEDLLKVGCIEAARKRAVDLWNSSLDPEFLERYFYPGTPYFTEEEAIEYVVTRLLYNREFHHDTYEELFIDEKYEESFLKPWDKQKVLEAFFVRWMSWIGLSEFDDIEKLAGDIASKSNIPVKIELKELAVKAAQVALEEGWWDYYRRICQLWLPKQLAEAKKIDTTKIY